MDSNLVRTRKHFQSVGGGIAALEAPLIAAGPRAREFPTLHSHDDCCSRFLRASGRGASAPAESAVKVLLPPEENKGRSIRVDASASYRVSESTEERRIPAENFHKKRFVLLSAAVYAASLADMRETMRVRNEPWWYERDPLARPIVRLPVPAYYTVGLVLATGVNWLSWKMAHSRRWHKMALLPQLSSIAGNTYGFKSNASY